MYQVHGWWFPDQDTHFAEMLGKNIAKGGQPVYQEPVRQRSIGHCQQRGLAIDVGANVGLWSRDLCNYFQTVIAVEPVAEFRECLARNVTANNLQIKPVALGAAPAMINMIITPANTGHSHVDMDSVGQGNTEMITLDSLDLPQVDYIKIDCEGFENNIILGAQKTILKYRPIMVVEDKKHQDVGHGDTDLALDTLISWGARVIDSVKNDKIVGWP